MSKLESLGIQRIEGLHYYVHDLERSRRFYIDLMDFAETWRRRRSSSKSGKQRSVCFQAGEIVIVCSHAARRGRPRRALPAEAPRRRRHADLRGRGRRARVPPARGARRHADRRDPDASPTTAARSRQFSITTPFGDTTFRFVERRGYRALVSRRGAASPSGAARGRGTNRFGFDLIDHVTSNFQTMKPALLWLEHVLGFEQLWEVEFHTSDVEPGRKTGSGLRSIVMWDPASSVKFANNEP